MEPRLGILLWSQGTDWPSIESAARSVDELGFDHLWTWDHLYAIFGNPYQPIFEGWMSLAAWAKVTKNVRLGLLVGANTFRNPGLVARLATTLDHMSGGRAILGLGGAWFQLEHDAHGLDFGASPGMRLTWLDEAAGVIKRLLAGEEVTHKGDHYTFDHLRLIPGPVQAQLPLMIGGSGERKTLRTVARYADMWNAIGTPAVLGRKIGVLRDHCEAVGRDPAEIECTVGYKPIIRDTTAEARKIWEQQMEHNQTPIERVLSDDSFWVGTTFEVAEKMAAYQDLGFTTFIGEMAAPYDRETLERLVNEVKPLVAKG